MSNPQHIDSIRRRSTFAQGGQIDSTKRGIRFGEYHTSMLLLLRVVCIRSLLESYAFWQMSTHSILLALSKQPYRMINTDPIRIYRIARSVPHHKRYGIRGKYFNLCYSTACTKHQISIGIPHLLASANIDSYSYAKRMHRMAISSP